MLTFETEPSPDLILQEQSHRFFNSLQVIDSLLSEIGRSGACDTAGALRELRARVHALSQLHRRIALPVVSAEFLEDQCRDLCQDLIRCFGRNDMTAWVDVRGVHMSEGRLSRLVLLIVELVTNALKHCRSDGAGVVWVDLKPRGVRCAELTVCDNGASSAQGMAPPKLRMARALADSLGGVLQVTVGEGFGVRVRFPVVEPNGVLGALELQSRVSPSARQRQAARNRNS